MELARGIEPPTVAGSALNPASRLLQGGQAPSYAPPEGGTPPSEPPVGGSMITSIPFHQWLAHGAGDGHRTSELRFTNPELRRFRHASPRNCRHLSTLAPQPARGRG